VCTVVLGAPASYALSVLHWRGRGTTFALALLIRAIPFQLLISPLCVLIARSHGLADSPALVTVVLLTFIGPWNEFLWPFLITKRAGMQPLAVSLANHISSVAGYRPPTQSVPCLPVRWCWRRRW
jgi:multiple sugar transport system permease protein